MTERMDKGKLDFKTVQGLFLQTLVLSLRLLMWTQLNPTIAYIYFRTMHIANL